MTACDSDSRPLIRMIFNELKVLVLMRSGSRRTDAGTEADRRTGARGLAMGGCGWPPFADCSSPDDEEEYYGREPRPRSLGFEDREPRLQAGLDAVSLSSSTEGSTRAPQCRICFQGPEQVKSSHQQSCSCLCSSTPRAAHG
ncbi:E3 ubiquitin-protein ligase MARCH9-like [Arapaima gigas]